MTSPKWRTIQNTNGVALITRRTPANDPYPEYEIEAYAKVGEQGRANLYERMVYRVAEYPRGRQWVIQQSDGVQRQFPTLKGAAEGLISDAADIASYRNFTAQMEV